MLQVQPVGPLRRVERVRVQVLALVQVLAQDQVQERVLVPAGRRP